MRILVALAALSLVASPTTAAAPCRNTHGKFVKCTKVTKVTQTRCRNAKGHFAKCK